MPLLLLAIYLPPPFFFFTVIITTDILVALPLLLVFLVLLLFLFASSLGSRLLSPLAVSIPPTVLHSTTDCHVLLLLPLLLHLDVSSCSLLFSFMSYWSSLGLPVCISRRLVTAAALLRNGNRYEGLSQACFSSFALLYYLYTSTRI